MVDDRRISLAVEKLEELLINKTALPQGVREDVMCLRTELLLIIDFIHDTEENQDGDVEAPLWVSDIRDLSDEVLFTVERFNLNEGSALIDQLEFNPFSNLNQVSALTGSEFNPFFGFMGDVILSTFRDIIFSQFRPDRINLNEGSPLIGSEFKSLKEKVRDFHIIKSMRGSGEGTSDGPNADKDCLVGLEDVEAKLLAQLTSEEPTLSVISIYGAVGSGKTALARKLYNSDIIIQRFQCRAWVSLSPTYDNSMYSTLNSPDSTYKSIRGLITTLRSDLTKEELERLERMDWGQIEQELRHFLEGLHYLVVLDDFRDSYAWGIWRRVLPDNRNGSRVILTTRKSAVAKKASENGYIQKLQYFLKPEESWDLFLKNVFAGDKDVNCSLAMEMEILAREMVGKCCGYVPLATIVLGQLLSNKKTLQEWEEVNDHIWQQLTNASPHISKLFTSSYNHLSRNEQKCLLYMAMFPEGYEFDVEKLMYLWTVEQFIEQFSAYEILFELRDSGLIQVGGRVWDRLVKCRVHDLPRYLAIEKAKKVRLFDIFDPYKYDSVTLLHQRHAIHGYLQNYISLAHRNSNLCTLLFFKQHREYFTGIDQLLSKCMGYNSLGVLDLKGIYLSSNKHLPDMIGKLVNLKFLGLANTFIREIPPSIGNLKSLQILEATGEYSCKLPEEICELENLSHLMGHFEGPLHIEDLTNLQTLKVVEFGQMSSINSKNATHLRDLTLCNPSSESTLDFITSLERLNSLIMISSHNALPPLQPLHSLLSLQRLWLHGPIEKMPNVHDFPAHLTGLILSKSKFANDPMPQLELLPFLMSLELINCYQGKKFVCTINGFPSLEVLQLSELYKLEEWELEEGAMPSIVELGIHECNQLMIPERLRDVPRLTQSETNNYLQDIMVNISH